MPSTDRKAATAFPLLLRRIRRRYPSVRKFAEALDIDTSRLSRAMNRKTGQPFDVYGCLRLARITGEPPSVVLRASGKAHIAQLIEELYGLEKLPLGEEEKTLLAAYHTIPEAHVRASLVAIAQAAAGHGPPPEIAADDDASSLVDRRSA